MSGVYSVEVEDKSDDEEDTWGRRSKDCKERDRRWSGDHVDAAGQLARVAVFNRMLVC